MARIQILTKTSLLTAGSALVMSMSLPAMLFMGIARPNAAQPVQISNASAVVELFTSQGCSSCPPADRLIGEMAASPNLLALSFPVDYWDYIGWKDTLAQPAFTARQKAYASARGDGQVYTPQAIINGLNHAVGSQKPEIEAAIRATKGKDGALTLPLDVSVLDNKISIHLGASSSSSTKSAGIWLLGVTHAKNVAIGRGENAGSSVIYTNVVRSMTKIGEWNGSEVHVDASTETAKNSGSDGFVVLVQGGTTTRPGPILAAAKSVGL